VELTMPPRPPSWFKGASFSPSKGRGWRGRRREREKEGKEREQGDRSPSHIHGSAPDADGLLPT